MRLLFSLLLLSFAAQSGTLVWDQPAPGEGNVAPEGWQLFANGEQVWQGSVQSVDVDALNLPSGEHVVAVRAFLNEQVSGFSNEVTLSIDYPGAPLEVAPDIYFRGVGNQSAGPA